MDFADTRSTKRRRTLPPVLDGAQRGWAKSLEDDEEEDDEYDDDDNYGNHPSPLDTQAAQSEYQTTNSMLRDLHTLHQHRLLFASPGLMPVHVLQYKAVAKGAAGAKTAPMEFHTSLCMSAPPCMTCAAPTISRYKAESNVSNTGL